MVRKLVPALLVAALLAACKRPVSPAKERPEPPPPPLFLYLVNCDSSVARLDLNTKYPPATALLAARTSAYLIPATRRDQCSVDSPRIEARNGRLFVVSPSDEGRGRTWRLLGFRLPDFVFTAAIELERPSARAPSLLVSQDGGRLLVSSHPGDIVQFDIGAVRAARPLPDEIDEAEFGDQAYLGPDGQTIYDRENRIQPDGDTDEFSLDNLTGKPEGAALAPWLGGGRARQQRIAAEYADGAAGRILYRLAKSKSAGPALAVLDTNSDRVTVIPLPEPAAEARFDHNGAHVVAVVNGVLRLYAAHSGNETAHFDVPELKGANLVRLLCTSPRGEWIFTPADNKLLIFDTRTARRVERDSGVTIDASTHCLFAGR